MGEDGRILQGGCVVKVRGNHGVLGFLPLFLDFPDSWYLFVVSRKLILNVPSVSSYHLSWMSPFTPMIT
jgi:hypothetical protein